MKPLLPCAAAAFLSFLLASSSALASEQEPADPSVAAPDMPTTRWYGYQTLIADVAATTLTTAGFVKAVTEIGPISFCGAFSTRYDCPPSRPNDHTASTALLVSGVVTYAFASPTIHAVHGHWDKAAVSLGLRAVPLALALPLMSAGDDDMQRVGGGVLLVGLVAAMVLDEVLIAREPTAKDAPSSVFSIAPTVDTKNGGAGLTAVATF